MTPVQQFINIARGWVGTKEEPVGSNRSFHIDVWNKSCGVPLGSFWCASFLCAAVHNRWKFLTGLDWQLGTSASCDVLLARARRLGILHKTPYVGDIGFVLAPKDDTDAVHVFLVSGFKDGKFTSIEGNSNLDGSRNGTEVVERPDLYKFRNPSRIVFARWADLIDEVADGWNVVIGSDTIKAVNANGKTYSPLRPMLEALYGEEVKTRLTFDLVPLWDGGTIPCSPIIMDGKSMVSVRDFANWQGLNIVIDDNSIVLKR
jgi:hypothetical protein